jgi:hypothetical protein
MNALETKNETLVTLENIQLESMLSEIATELFNLGLNASSYYMSTGARENLKRALQAKRHAILVELNDR